MKMKQFLLLLLAMVCQYSYSQISPVKVPAINILSRGTFQHVIDTSFKVIHTDRQKSDPPAALFLNGKFVSESIFKTMNRKFIKDVRVRRQDTTIGSKKYRGQIFLVTSKGYAPDLVSLAEIKATYAPQDIPAIIMIDDEIMEGDYDEYLVDKYFILRIIVKPYELPKERLRFNMIQIVTKTEENIRKVNEIRLRGTEIF
jgi:hypothetical protein